MSDRATLLFDVDRALAELLAGRWDPETAARRVAALYEFATAATRDRKN